MGIEVSRGYGREESEEFWIGPPMLRRVTMPDQTYKLIDLVGVSSKSFADAANNAVKKASKTLRGLAWFEVVELRGKIEDGKISGYQATIKVGFKLDD